MLLKTVTNDVIRMFHRRNPAPAVGTNRAHYTMFLAAANKIPPETFKFFLFKAR